MKSLYYLETRQTANAVKRTFGSPKSWIPVMLIGLGALLFPAFSLILGLMVERRGIAPASVNPQYMETIRTILILAITGYSVLKIASAFSQSFLIFPVSAIDFLFPSPISRRTVLIHKLLQNYISIALASAFFIMVSMPLTFSALGRPIFPGIVVVWADAMLLAVFISNITHILNIIATFKLAELVWVDRTTRTITYISGLVFIALMFCFVFLSSGKFDFYFHNAAKMLPALNNLVQSPWVKIPLFPAVLSTDLALSSFTKPEYPPVLGFAVMALLAALSFLLLINRHENIYEPSIDVSTQKAREINAVMHGETSPQMREQMAKKVGGQNFKSLVPPFGRGATAIIWKNAVAAIRFKSPVRLILMMVALIAFIVWRLQTPVSTHHDGYTSNILIFFIIVGTQASQEVTRKELKQNLLKAMPIKGWKVILAQVTSQCIVICASVLLLLIILKPVGGLQLLLYALLGPSVAFAFASGGNLAALCYPDLSDTTHNLLSKMLGGLLGSIPVGVSMMLAALLQPFGVPMFIIIGLVVSFNLAYAALMIAGAGRLYDRFDPTSE